MVTQAASKNPRTYFGVFYLTLDHTETELTARRDTFQEAVVVQRRYQESHAGRYHYYIRKVTRGVAGPIIQEGSHA